MADVGKKKIKYKGISTLEILLEAKNYNQWIADEIKKHISGRSLEIGAGTGNLSNYLINNEHLYISDVDSGLVDHLKKRFSDEKNISVQLLDITKNPPNKFLSYFSTIYAVNVLEHIENDVQALKNIGKLLNKDGKIVLLVPAKKFAFTRLDKELGHFRRYEKDELVNKMNKSGYLIENIYFINIVGLLSWVIRNKVKRNNIQLKPYHIALFDSIVPLLRIIESYIKIPLGISLIAVARKVN